MKYTILYALFVLTCINCTTIVENEATVSFWTDMDLDSNVEYILFINDNPSGKFIYSQNDAVCGDIQLIDIPITNEEDMILKLKTNLGEIINIGMINVYGISNGITVKSNYNNALFVQHDIDEYCTRVRVRW